MHSEYLERVVDLTDPNGNRILNMSVEEARARILRGPLDGIRQIEGSFALVAKEWKTVRLARSLDRPMRYFLAKRHEGPALVVANRIDAIKEWLKANGFADQFHPQYTRMVHANHVVQIHLIGCPDPDPVYERFFAPRRNALPTDLAQLGGNYIGALADEIQRWLTSLPPEEPIGVCFSGGIDSGSVFLVTYHCLRKLGMNPARLKAFTLAIEEGPDLAQAREFLDRLDLNLFLEPIEAEATALDPRETIRVVEDYKALDIESATMALALCRGIRRHYPDWKFLIDGDGGDENLKD
ncbi:MAG: asparagine synthase-related protein, partial [Limisphaerales bacterium]